MKLLDVPKHFREELRVSELGPCLIWKKSSNNYGYGQVKIEELNKQEQTHHVMWFIVYGYWPKQLNHYCNQRPCGNTEHMYNGTQKQNILDARNIGTRPGQKLNSEQVIEIRKLYFTKKYPQKRIAIMFDISQGYISNIICRRTWSDI